MVDFPKLSISGLSLFLTKTSDHFNQISAMHSYTLVKLIPGIFTVCILRRYHCKRNIGNFKMADFSQVENVLILNGILNISTKLQHYHTSRKSIWLTFHE